MGNSVLPLLLHIDSEILNEELFSLNTKFSSALIHLETPKSKMYISLPS